MNNSLTVEIRKAGFVNKGAMMMLLAAIQKINARYPDARIVIEPTPIDGTQPYIEIARVGSYLKGGFTRCGCYFGFLFEFIPAKVRSAYGIVLEKEIDVVLDAAGFAYTDQWGVGMNRDLARASSRWKRNNTKFILLPQAFGPFNSKKSKGYASQWLNNADLVCARDQTSQEIISSIVGARTSQKYFRDFTNLLNPKFEKRYSDLEGAVAVVPNMRMVDMSSNISKGGYFEFLSEAIDCIKSSGKDVFLLAHEGDDLCILGDLQFKYKELSIIEEDDPQVVKGVLANCSFVLASRFHAIVSCLSQNVPCIGTGWSHKYERLYADYDSSEYLIKDISDFEKLSDCIAALSDDKFRASVGLQLKQHSEILKEESESMWEQVFSIMESK
jgi:polysaccharide pyruvyl transferase WcaK-like protein